MRKTVLIALMVVLAAVPAIAQEAQLHPFFGTFRPALSLTFNAGLNADSTYNSGMNLMAGPQIALARMGHLRFPTVGVEAGLLSYCPTDGLEFGTGPDGRCKLTGALQFTTGFEVILGGSFSPATQHEHNELAIAGGVARVVAGPLRDHWGVRLGLTFRHSSKR